VAGRDMVVVASRPSRKFSGRPTCPRPERVQSERASEGARRQACHDEEGSRYRVLPRLSASHRYHVCVRPSRLPCECPMARFAARRA